MVDLFGELFDFDGDDQLSVIEEAVEFVVIDEIKDLEEEAKEENKEENGGKKGDKNNSLRGFASGLQNGNESKSRAGKSQKI